MKTTRETKWKVAAAVLVLGLAALTVWAWRAPSSERHVQAQVRRAVRLEAQAGGPHAGMALAWFSVPAWFPANLR